MQEYRHGPWLYVSTSLRIAAYSAIALVAFVLMQSKYGAVLPALVAAATILTLAISSLVFRMILGRVARDEGSYLHILATLRRLFTVKLLVLLILLACSMFTQVHWLSIVLAVWSVVVGATLGIIVWRQSKDADKDISPPSETEVESARLYGRKLGLILGLVSVAALDLALLDVHWFPNQFFVAMVVAQAVISIVLLRTYAGRSRGQQ